MLPCMHNRLRPSRASVFAALGMILCSIILSLGSPPARAQDEATLDPAVETAREALRNSGNYPWYDDSQDAASPIPIATASDADSANRGSKWTKQPSTWNWRWGNWSLFGSLLNVLGITLLIVVLGLLIYLITQAFLKDESSEGRTASRKVIESTRDVDRVEALPFKLRKPTSDFLSETRRLYEAGQFSEAIIYFFSYQLVELDRQHLIRLAKGKTNRQYLREVRQRPTLRAILEPTMIAFEDAFFGHKTISREQFEACWLKLDDFQRDLAVWERAAA